MSQNILYPIQPFFVINSIEYYKKTSSCPAIAHFYRFTSSDSANGSFAVPDGAMDVIFECDTENPEARICGTVHQGQDAGFKDGHTYFGVRLLPGSFDHLGEASVKELMNNETLLDDVFRNSFLSEQIQEEKEFTKQIALFEQHFLQYSGLENSSSHTLAAAIMQEIYDAGGNIRVSDLEEKLTYSKRHLSRTFEAATGMNIKTFSNYIRFQSILKSMNNGEFASLSDAAYAGNYYDQAHFQKDFKRFASTTPKEYLKLLKECKYQEKLTVL